MSKKNRSIGDMTSAVFDNGRRGVPRAGCDCVQCFGYCLIDRDEALRTMQSKSEVSRQVGPILRNGPLFFTRDFMNDEVTK